MVPCASKPVLGLVPSSCRVGALAVCLCFFTRTQDSPWDIWGPRHDDVLHLRPTVQTVPPTGVSTVLLSCSALDMDLDERSFIYWTLDERSGVRALSSLHELSNDKNTGGGGPPGGRTLVSPRSSCEAEFLRSPSKFNGVCALSVLATHQQARNPSTFVRPSASIGPWENASCPERVKPKKKLQNKPNSDFRSASLESSLHRSASEHHVDRCLELQSTALLATLEHSRSKHPRLSFFIRTKQSRTRTAGREQTASDRVRRLVVHEVEGGIHAVEPDRSDVTPARMKCLAAFRS